MPFFVYAGLEVGAGQWAYSWLVEGRQVPAGAGAAWLAVYWGSLTAGRVALGALPSRVPIRTLLRTALAAVPAGVLVLWAGVGPAAGASGLLLLGLALAPIFPLLIATTPDRVGAAYATHAIGFQVAAFYLGSAILPGAAGLLARHLGLDVLGPFLLVTAIGLAVLCASAPGDRVRRETAARGRGWAGTPSGAERRARREPGSPFVVSNRGGHQDSVRHPGRQR
jgi:fucose permease